MDDEAFGNTSAISARVESSYLINLRDLDVKHVKDFVFVHGEYIDNSLIFYHTYPALFLPLTFYLFVYFYLLLYCLYSLCPVAF